MENISDFGSGLSWENPFSGSEFSRQSDCGGDEQFLGTGSDLKAILDKEEKMYQSTASLKSDIEEKSCMTPSGITMRSFMIDSGDGDLLHQKLTMSQYIAFKSEPLGTLGESPSLGQRPIFSFREKEPLNNESIDIGPVEFNPDFSQEPSWLRKGSLSSLSNSERLEMSAAGPECSENWLITKEAQKENITRASAAQMSVMLANERTETSELPSMYWKPCANTTDVSRMTLAHSKLEDVESTNDLADKCRSYVAGHVENAPLPNSFKRFSDAPSSSQSSASVASTVRENEDFQRLDSLMSEPQLSSTREISDDDISSKQYYSLPERRSSVKTKSVTSDPGRGVVDQLSQLMPSLHVPNSPQSSTPKNPPAVVAAAAPAPPQEKISPQVELSVLQWRMVEQELSRRGNEAIERSALSAESLMAVLSNTSSLSTPNLMNKIKERVLRSRGQSESESSGIGGSGFDSRSQLSRDDNCSSFAGAAAAAIPAPYAEVRFGGGGAPKTSIVRSSSTAASAQVIRSVAEEQRPKTPDFNAMPHRHTMSNVPVHSTPAANAKPGCKTLDAGNEFSRVTATVMKKVPADTKSTTRDVPKARTNLVEQRMAPVIKCNKSHVYFGGCGLKMQEARRQQIIVRNSSYKQTLDLEMRIKDCDVFKIVDANQGLVSKRVITFEPRQEHAVDVSFQPGRLGHFATKLNLYPRCDTAKKVKYTVDLSGYGGASQVITLVPNSTCEKVLLPKSNGQFWSCQYAVQNRGNVAAFVYSHAVDDDGALLEASHCIILPQCYTLNVGETKEVNVFIHPSKNCLPESFKVNLFSADEPLRQRWAKRVMGGAALKPPQELGAVDWMKLLQLDGAGSPVKSAVTDDDMPLFYSSVKMDEIAIVFHETTDDSHFVTLAMESATMMESTCSGNDTIMSQRRFTTTNSGRLFDDGCVSAAVTEIIFPCTHVGSVSSQKIPLQNWSSNNQEIRVRKIDGPFSMKHLQSAVPGGYYTRMPIFFNPNKKGNHSGYIVLDVGQMGQSLNIALRGEAV